MLPWGMGILILLVDQWTKALIRQHWAYAESRPIIEGFFHLVYVRNDGAAWSILSGQQVILILISVAVLVFLIWKGRAEFMVSRLKQVVFGLLMGGIAGNLADRIRFGWVTDFLDFQFGSYHFPSFNIADAAICIAVFLYLYSDLKARSQQQVHDAT